MAIDTDGFGTIVAGLETGGGGGGGGSDLTFRSEGTIGANEWVGSTDYPLVTMPASPALGDRVGVMVLSAGSVAPNIGQLLIGFDGSFAINPTTYDISIGESAEFFVWRWVGLGWLPEQALSVLAPAGVQSATAAATSDFNFNDRKLRSVDRPTSYNDVATKGYADDGGVAWRAYGVTPGTDPGESVVLDAGGNSAVLFANKSYGYTCKVVARHADGSSRMWNKTGILYLDGSLVATFSVDDLYSPVEVGSPGDWDVSFAVAGQEFQCTFTTGSGTDNVTVYAYFRTYEA